METAIVILRESDETLLEGYGATQQEEESRAWAKRRQVTVVGVELVVETGRKWNRERFDAVIEKCIRRHHTEGVKWVIFPRVDRDARKQIIFGYYLGLLCKEGMEVAFAREDITTEDSPEKKLILSIHAYKAEADGDTVVTNLWQGKVLRAREEGRFPSWDGGLWPYRYIPSRRKKGGAVREIIPERAGWCRKWYEWLRQGMKGNEIAERMNRSGVPPARGKHWKRQTIFRILKNKGLRGKASWNGIPLRPEASPAIFTDEEGEEIDRLLAINIEMAKRNAHEDYELSGHVFCECGNKVWGRRNKVRNLLYIRYQCYRCGRYVEKVSLEALVKTKVMPLLADPERLAKYLAEHGQDDGHQYKERLVNLEKEINRRLTYLHNLKRQHAWGDWTDEEYLQERDKAMMELERLQSEKGETENAYAACLDGFTDRRVLERIADWIHEQLTVGDSKLLRQVYNALKLRVTLTKQGITVSALVPLEDFDVVATASRYYYRQEP